MIEVENKQDLIELVEAHDKVLACFCASWCPFCDLFSPVFDKYAKNSGSTKFIRVYVDEDSNPLWEEYSIEAVPAIILFENGNVSKRLDGGLGSGIREKQFSDWLKNL